MRPSWSEPPQRTQLPPQRRRNPWTYIVVGVLLLVGSAFVLQPLCHVLFD